MANHHHETLIFFTSLILIPMHLNGFDMPRWIPTSQINVTALPKIKAPDAWDSECPKCELKPGYLVRLTVDGNHLTVAWFPEISNGMRFAWKGKEVTRGSSSDNDPTTHESLRTEFLQYQHPAVSWVVADKADVAKARGITVGTLKDGKLVSPCRGFQSDNGDRRLVIGRAIHAKGKGSGGCIIHRNGEEVILESFEVLQLNLFGMNDLDGNLTIQTTPSYCRTKTCIESY